MTQQMQAQPQRRRPSEVTIPQLTPEETRRRAERGFDAAVNAVIRSQFNAAPPVSEMNALRAIVDRMASGGREVDLAAAVDEYIEANPNSVIARYYNATNGSTDWLVSGGRLGFNRSALQSTVRSMLGAARTPLIEGLVRLCDPRNRSVPLDVRNLVELMPNAMPEMQRQLEQQFGNGRNQVPVTIAYNSQEQQLVLTSKLPPPPQEVRFD